MNKLTDQAARGSRGGLSLLLVLAVLNVASARTLTVDDDGDADFVAIQAAIEAADPAADDVFVRCGTYSENLVMRDGVSVRGAGRRCTSIVPLQDDRPVILFEDVGAATEFSGFTVHNVDSASLSSRGIDVRFGAPVITRNVIEGEPGVSFTGAGITIDAGARPVISYNVIRGNRSCCFGGGVASFYSSPLLRSNLIVGNASYYGGGIMAEGGKVRIEHNTIVDNEGWLGGGLLVSGPDTPILRANIVASNTAQIYGGGIAEWTTFDAVDNDVFGNAPDDYSATDPTGSDGNVSVDPQFVNPVAGEIAGFGLRSSSPLIDRAAADTAPQFDVVGLARPIDGDTDGDPRPDPGAFENAGITGLLVQPSALNWDRGRQKPETYDLFRGDLAVLRDGGAYTQDPQQVDAARALCGIARGASDEDRPDPGDGYFFLVAASGGTLGFDSSLAERTRTLECDGALDGSLSRLD